MLWVAATIVVLFSLLGVALTFLTLPGIWTMLLVGLVCAWWQPGLMSWWTLGGVAGIAILAEVVEFAASAIGSGKAGGTRYGALGSIVGSIAGLIVGGIVLAFLPVIGSIIGAVIGAGVGAVGAEVWLSKRKWSEAWRSGRGAATGRAVSIFLKGGLAVVAACVLIAAAVVN